MITFSEYVTEGFKKRSNNNTAHDRFNWDLQDAVWDILRQHKIPKEDVDIEVHVIDAWRNHQVDIIHSKQPHPSGMKKIVTKDWVLMRFTANREGRKVEHDVELLYHVLKKQLRTTIEPFFKTIQEDSTMHLYAAGPNGWPPVLYMKWNVWEPKWPA